MLFNKTVTNVNNNLMFQSPIWQYLIIYIYVSIYILKESEMLWKWWKEAKTYIAV